MKTAILLGLMLCVAPLQSHANDISMDEFEKMLNDVENGRIERKKQNYREKIAILESIASDFDLEPVPRRVLYDLIKRYRTKIQELALDRKCVK